MQRTDNGDHVLFEEGTLKLRIYKTSPPTFRVEGTFGADGVQALLDWQSADADIQDRGTILSK